jgi:hypothetical protein
MIGMQMSSNTKSGGFSTAFASAAAGRLDVEPQDRQQLAHGYQRVVVVIHYERFWPGCIGLNQGSKLRRRHPSQCRGDCIVGCRAASTDSVTSSPQVLPSWKPRGRDRPRTAGQGGKKNYRGVRADIVSSAPTAATTRTGQSSRLPRPCCSPLPIASPFLRLPPRSYVFP